jgi:hypothetical protein
LVVSVIVILLRAGFVVSAFAKKSGDRVAQTVSLRRMRGRTWSHRRLTVCAAVTGVQGAFLISDSMF